jgi:hypothetical protein
LHSGAARDFLGRIVGCTVVVVEQLQASHIVEQRALRIPVLQRMEVQKQHRHTCADRLVGSSWADRKTDWVDWLQSRAWLLQSLPRAFGIAASIEKHPGMQPRVAILPNEVLH